MQSIQIPRRKFRGDKRDARLRFLGVFRVELLKSVPQIVGLDDFRGLTKNMTVRLLAALIVLGLMDDVCPKTQNSSFIELIELEL